MFLTKSKPPPSRKCARRVGHTLVPIAALKALLPPQLTVCVVSRLWRVLKTILSC